MFTCRSVREDMEKQVCLLAFKEVLRFVSMSSDRRESLLDRGSKARNWVWVLEWHGVWSTWNTGSVRWKHLCLGPHRLGRAWNVLRVLPVSTAGEGVALESFEQGLTRSKLFLDISFAYLPDFYTLGRNLRWRPGCGFRRKHITAFVIGCLSAVFLVSQDVHITPPVFLHLLLHSAPDFTRQMIFVKTTCRTPILTVGS